MFKTDTDKMSVWTFAKANPGGPREFSKVFKTKFLVGRGQGAKVRQLEKTFV